MFEEQKRLAEYCKSGKQNLVDFLPKERSRVYRRLVFNTVKNTLDNAYPIAREFLGPENWGNFIQDFFSSYPLRSPYLWKMPYDLCLFAKSKRYCELWSAPFLNELLYFEWIEIEAMMSENVSFPEFSTEGDWKKDPLIINPKNYLLFFHYPVFREAPEEIKKNADSLKGKYFLLCFRHPTNHKVFFYSLSCAMALFWEILQKNPTSFEEALPWILESIPKCDEEALEREASQVLPHLIQSKAILGTQSKTWLSSIASVKNQENKL